MVYNKPARKLLTAWRVYLALAAAVPAFLTSLLFGIFGAVWTTLTLIWLVLFLTAYLWYLPALYKRQGFRLEADRIVKRGGLIIERSQSVPLEKIQYVSKVAFPLDRLLGLKSLIIAVPGGMMTIYGLNAADAVKLAGVLVSARGEYGKEGGDA